MFQPRQTRTPFGRQAGAALMATLLVGSALGLAVFGGGQSIEELVDDEPIFLMELVEDDALPPPPAGTEAGGAPQMTEEPEITEEPETTEVHGDAIAGLTDDPFSNGLFDNGGGNCIRDCGEGSGSTLRHVAIDERGRVSSLSFLACPEVFQDSTRRALMRWRFEPLSIDGVAGPTTTTANITFRLS